MEERIILNVIGFKNIEKSQGTFLSLGYKVEETKLIDPMNRYLHKWRIILVKAGRKRGMLFWRKK
ncbi:MAG: hypothetical protein WC499_00775 [Patescibacteria group bacterium]